MSTPSVAACEDCFELDAFMLPEELSASVPPEARGLDRDEVRLLVAGPDGLVNAQFWQLGSFLEPGDLLVVNTSATIPAAVDARLPDGRDAVVHFSTEL